MKHNKKIGKLLAQFPKVFMIGHYNLMSFNNIIAYQKKVNKIYFSRKAIYE